MGNLIVAYSSPYTTSEVVKFNPTGVLLPVSRLKYKGAELMPMETIIPMIEYPTKRLDDPINEFHDRMLRVAKDVVARGEELGLPLALMWSGGFDSTAAYLALKAVGAKVKVLMTRVSILENPAMFHQLICKDDIAYVSEYSKFEYLLVNGDLGDQLFGSDFYQQVDMKLGNQRLYDTDYQATFIDYQVQSGCSTAAAETIFERYVPIVDEAPFGIHNFVDFAWWLNFTQKWQSVRLRYMLHVPAEKRKFVLERMYPFFEHPLLQDWAIAAPTEAKIDGSIETYKLSIREFITQFGSEDFLVRRKVWSQVNILLFDNIGHGGVLADLSDSDSNIAALNAVRSK
jgi:hypothetical protein